ncbi:hypothetical protein EV683_10274 [Crenobacter luteus]|nr:hypothetical protein EV683_10274 [Crenobacter luteus]
MTNAFFAPLFYTSIFAPETVPPVPAMLNAAAQAAPSPGVRPPAAQGVPTP